jgi:hypothetical protein
MVNEKMAYRVYPWRLFTPYTSFYPYPSLAPQPPGPITRDIVDGQIVKVVEPTFYGSCAAMNGSVVVNQCLRGTQATPVYGNGCVCYDPATQWYGCGNTANGVCRMPVWL